MKWAKMIKLPDWSEDVEWALRRKHALGLYAWSVIYAVVVTIIWILVGHYVGSGWIGFVVNIVGFLMSVAILASVTLPALKILMPTPLAWLCTLATWAVAVGLLRSLIAAWLGG